MLERWLSRASDKAQPITSAVVGEEAVQTVSSQRLVLRKLAYGDIQSFMDLHNLDLNGANFDFARDIVTGRDNALTRVVQHHLTQGNKLNNAAVQAILARHRPEHFTVEKLAATLDNVDGQLATLIGIADKTQGTASDYRQALEGQIAAMDSEQATSIASRLVTLTLGMVERSQSIEKEARASQKQCKKMHRELERARHEAEHDQLTGLPNRRAFEKRFLAEVNRTREVGGRLALAICDIDNFKRVNDGYGHETGDRVIKLVGSTLAKISGNHCHVARHGGEEFVILFPGMSVEEAAAVVDGARADVASRNLVQRDTGVRMENVTFSAGLSDAITSVTTQEALAAADKALYFAKANGRNCISIAGASAPILFQCNSA
ncbi:MAG: GGDEF domain-containing protein [Sphingopyxis sp.]